MANKWFIRLFYTHLHTSKTTIQCIQFTMKFFYYGNAYTIYSQYLFFNLLRITNAIVLLIGKKY